MKSKLKTLSIQILIFLVLGEIGSRLVISLPTHVEHLHFNTTEIDEELGWKSKANHAFRDTVEDGGESSYLIDYQSVKNGFRVYDDYERDTLTHRVMFIGDSYTQAVEVSNDKTFYHHLRFIEGLYPFQIFAYGASGFSTYQQYLIFEKYIDEVNPELVVWQFCSNDFVDNYHELEMEANYKIGVRRPYLNLKNEKEFQTPVPEVIKWSKYPRLVYGFYLIKEKIKKRFSKESKSAELKIAEDHLKYDLYKTSYEITDLILKKIKNKLPKKTKLLFFSADAYNPQMNDFTKLCQDNGINVTQATAHRLNEANFERKEMIFAYDNYHWNERGHEVVAEALKGEIRKLFDYNLDFE